MLFTVISNHAIAPGVYHMRLGGDTRAITKPGQFVQVSLPGFFLRRPLSVCDWRPGGYGTLELIYKVVGHGTERMRDLGCGTELDLLPGLGNGYDVNERDEVTACQLPLLVGGGAGVPPLYGLCKRLLAGCKTPTVILGFNTAGEIFWKREFEELGVPVTITTVDGSAGTEGFVTDAMRGMRGRYDYVYTCGPESMLKAVYNLCEAEQIHAQFSFEARMACGFGACMGCTIQTKYGAKRVCKDGPVLFREEIVW